MELPVGKGLAIVVAVARNGVIGKDGGLPWRLPEDLKHFRAVTTGHTIVMGRKTWDSIGRPLPHRRNVVVSRDPGLVLAGAEVAPNLEAALALAWQTDDEPRVIGGATIYAAALPAATVLHLTEVDQEVEGDTFFPPFDRAAFDEVSRRAGETPGVTFLELRRR
ncbi:MAG: dihydrofolate reductase [Myxococcales bacterium]|nr:dihydrofolate reductase [Myxococcales bacterium]